MYGCPVCNEKHIYNIRLDKYIQKILGVNNLVKKEVWDKQTGQNPIWRPEKKGEKIEGELLAKRAGQYGTVMDIRDSKNKIWTVFSSKLMEQMIGGIMVGDSLRIMYLGKIKLKNNREAHNWEVFRKAAPALQ